MKRLVYIFCLAVAGMGLRAQTPQAPQTIEKEYARSSLYTLLVSHPQAKYASQIDYVYLSLPSPDKYENHDLRVKRVTDTSTDMASSEAILRFLETNHVGRRMVAKWFDRNPETGAFDVDLVAERGNYNASMLDVELAQHSKRGLAMLSDMGEQLIGKTFVVVHDIVYVDKEAQAQMAASILRGIAQVAFAAALVSEASSTSSQSNTDTHAETAAASAIAGAAAVGSLIADNLTGFTVKVHTHLYQLEWDDTIADDFYSRYWIDANTPETERLRRKRLFEDSDDFHVRYVGSYQEKSAKIEFKGVESNEEIIRKVCARAMDRAIVGLQKKYEVFKVKTPVYSVENRTLTAQIGMKEGVAASSKFEVLLAVEKDDRTVYRRVAQAKPIKKEIWDNRFMAFEEQAKGSTITATTFKIKGAGEVYPGMLLRQIK